VSRQGIESFRNARRLFVLLFVRLSKYVLLDETKVGDEGGFVKRKMVVFMNNF
jgi:enolase